MDRLIAGHKRFLKEIFPGRKEQFKLLSDRQAPEWLFITCSDSRVVPDLILGTGPGDLFITRIAGNVVPITGNDVDGVTATIEYAVDVLRVKSEGGLFEIEVLGLSSVRGPASVAQGLYRETEGSKVARAKAEDERKLMAVWETDSGRPSKKDRREINKARGRVVRF